MGTAEGARHADFDRLAKLLSAIGTTDQAEIVALVYQWYVNTAGTPAATDGPVRADEVDPVAMLRAAHAASQIFDGGWRARSVSTIARVVAERDGRTRLLDRVDYVVPHRAGLAPNPGDALMVTRRLDWLDEATGFWHVQGGDWPPVEADRLVRIYVNIDPGAAGRVLSAISTLLEATRVHPYVLKVQTLPVAMQRSDIMVIYMSPAGFAHRRADIRAAMGTLEQYLRPATPRLTETFALGVSLAEGALDGRSYGEEVAQLAARSLDRVPMPDRRDVGAIDASLDLTWSAAGYDLAFPSRRPKGAPGRE